MNCKQKAEMAHVRLESLTYVSRQQTLRLEVGRMRVEHSPAIARCILRHSVHGREDRASGRWLGGKKAC